MKMKWILFLIQFIGIFMIILLINESSSVHAETIRAVETEGIVGFHGKYESESEPKPEPPSGPGTAPVSEMNHKKSEGRLPQMGEILTYKWILIGLSLTLIMLYRRNKVYQKQLKLELAHQ